MAEVLWGQSDDICLLITGGGVSRSGVESDVNDGSQGAGSVETETDEAAKAAALLKTFRDFGIPLALGRYGQSTCATEGAGQAKQD
jgi:hypothetical protein